MIKVKHSPYIICSLFACLSLTGCIKDLEGKNSLIRQIAEPPGVNCSAGGYKVVTGLDDNRNGELDDNEIQETSYVCGGNKETLLSFSDDIGYYTSSVHGVIPRTLGID